MSTIIGFTVWCISLIAATVIEVASATRAALTTTATRYCCSQMSAVCPSVKYGDHTFRRWASANLNIWLLHDHACLDGLTTGTSELGIEHPFAIGIGQNVDGDGTKSFFVIGARCRAKANSPTNLCCFVSVRVAYVKNGKTRTLSNMPRYSSGGSNSTVCFVAMASW